MEPSRAVPQVPLSAPEATARSRVRTARVVVAWRPLSDGGTSQLEPLCAARCSEVVLTAQSDDPPSKHLVFELAGLLTLKLAATQPLIRVRFLPPVEHAASRAKRRLIRCGTGLNLPGKR